MSLPIVLTKELVLVEVIHRTNNATRCPETCGNISHTSMTMLSKLIMRQVGNRHHTSILQTNTDCTLPVLTTLLTKAGECHTGNTGICSNTNSTTLLLDIVICILLRKCTNTTTSNTFKHIHVIMLLGVYTTSNCTGNTSSQIPTKPCALYIKRVIYLRTHHLLGLHVRISHRLCLHLLHLHLLHLLHLFLMLLFLLAFLAGVTNSIHRHRTCCHRNLWPNHNVCSLHTCISHADVSYRVINTIYYARLTTLSVPTNPRRYTYQSHTQSWSSNTTHRTLYNFDNKYII